ncbi:amino acid transporter, putative [Pediculus humanus corporis]|uniref:Amino acid transporter, putative n=1 Tax=Pediculus humanus subsp. corporis TaxID=121224 RepID=E0VBC2_PEDHC|nr:amino acid transporter, putative [Pediculus humanus corporis]EEB10678.1 amino acid transporter, putative [Pediculus humanus corporis]
MTNNKKVSNFGNNDEEGIPLLDDDNFFKQSKNISTVFAVACIIDQFGVNPIIALPKEIILCGWIGYPLALFVLLLTIYTGMLLGRCWIIAEHLDKKMILKNRYAYSALTEMAWGKTIGKFINVFINLSVFSNNIPALLIASQNLQFFDAKISNNVFNFSYCYWLIILGVALCPLTWLGSPKDTKWISVFSSFFVIVCAFLTWFCMLSDDDTKITPHDLFHFHLGTEYPLLLVY